VQEVEEMLPTSNEIIKLKDVRGGMGEEDSMSKLRADQIL